MRPGLRIAKDFQRILSVLWQGWDTTLVSLFTPKSTKKFPTDYDCLGTCTTFGPSPRLQLRLWLCYYAIPWWRHQMETFSALLALCAGNSPVTGELPAQRPVTRSFNVISICTRINGWVNNREAGDLRRHHTHYDVTVKAQCKDAGLPAYMCPCRFSQCFDHVYGVWKYKVVNQFNSLAPRRFERNLRKVIFKLILMIGSWGIICKIAPRWMPMVLTYDKSTLVQIMAWCRQATSHYLSQCWPRSMSPYGVIRP